MYCAAHLVAENAIHELVLVDPAEALEAVGFHLRAEVVAAAGQILHTHVSARKSALDPLLELVAGRHWDPMLIS